MNRVPVNFVMLNALRQWLSDRLSEGGIEESLRRFLERLLDITSKTIRMSQTSLTGPGHIPQVYAISPTGRLYARGLNLQNAPSLIKEAALHELWEYDFANCHFNIISQMAEKYGVPCPEIEHYLANKARVRMEIATDAGIGIDSAKRCLLPVLYGSTSSTREQDAIPSIIGAEAAKKLYLVPKFDALRAEVGKAGRAILSGWPKTANGSFTNSCDKAIRGNEAPARRLAHLVQGVEARALMAVVSLHPDDIILLQQDGFVSRRRLDPESLEDAVLNAVGYCLRLEEEQLRLHIDAAALADRTKSEMDREAAPVLGFDPVAAH